MPLRLKTYQAGTDRKRGEGLRIGTVRFLPRGVLKKSYAKENYFDVWLPTLAPSRKLLGDMKQREKKGADWETLWPIFKARYEREMLGNTESRQTLLLLAKLATQTPIAVGCYCANEKRCHRSILHTLIRKAATA
jgi:uncharacterized protein YeaO (DUF488 family)